MKDIIVFDIGGTEVKGGVFHKDCLIETFSFSTNAARGAEAVMEDVLAMIGKLMNSHDVQVIGISTTGQVDPLQGSILYANENMPGYTGMDIASRIYERFHIECAVENDVISAAIGEHEYGAAENTPDFLLLTIGTGIGGSLFINGSPYYGAGENSGLYIGSMYDLASQSPVTFEDIASTSALVRNAMKIDSSLCDGKAVLASKNTQIQALVKDWCATIGRGVAGMIHMYNVPMVILGGGIMEDERVFRSVCSCTREYLVPVFKNVKIRKAALGNTAGLYGAYYLAKQQIIRF